MPRASTALTIGSLNPARHPARWFPGDTALMPRDQSRSHVLPTAKLPAIRLPGPLDPSGAEQHALAAANARSRVLSQRAERYELRRRGPRAAGGSPLLYGRCPAATAILANHFGLGVLRAAGVHVCRRLIPTARGRMFGFLRRRCARAQNGRAAHPGLRERELDAR